MVMKYSVDAAAECDRRTGEGRPARRERKAPRFLAGEGMVEVINLPFTSERLNRIFTGLWGAPPRVGGAQSLGKESAEMRLSLIPGLIEICGSIWRKRWKALCLSPGQSLSAAQDGRRRNGYICPAYLWSAGASRFAHARRAPFRISRLQGAGGRRLGFVAHRR